MCDQTHSAACAEPGLDKDPYLVQANAGQGTLGRDEQAGLGSQNCELGALHLAPFCLGGQCLFNQGFELPVGRWGYGNLFAFG